MTQQKHQPGPYTRESRTVVSAMPATPLLLDEAQRRGWRLIYFWHWQGVLPSQIRPNGALVCQLPGSPTVTYLQKRCVCVRFGKLPHPDDDKLLAVLPDIEAEGRLAAEHFAERGFLHVAFWGHKPWGDFHSMFLGFRQRSEELGMSCHLYQTSRRRGESWQARVGRRRREFARWIQGVPKPIGLFSSGDWHAATDCIGLIEAGLTVPDDVALLSRGNHPDICQSCFPTISSLDLDEEGRLRTACDWLQRRMDGEAAPAAPIMFPPRGVIERESTNVLATPDRIVADAIRYIWNHLHMDVSVEQVAGHVGLSTSQLQRRFRKALGRSVVQELLRKRLDEAQQLLRLTSMSIADIAAKLGFQSDIYFYRVFRRRFGITPAVFRKTQ